MLFSVTIGTLFKVVGVFEVVELLCVTSKVHDDVVHLIRLFRGCFVDVLLHVYGGDSLVMFRFGTESFRKQS